MAEPQNLEILDFERAALFGRLGQPKARAIRERFGLSPWRYQQELNRIIDRPDALAYDPMLVTRLLRLREGRRRLRFAHRLDSRSA